MSLPYRQRQHQRRGHYCRIQQCVAFLACWLAMAGSLTLPLHANRNKRGGSTSPACARRFYSSSNGGRPRRCSPPSAAATEGAVVMASPTGGRKKLVVIGGGAAGYFGAIQAAACGAGASSSLDVIVLEAGRLPLQKVKISGGGRCNVMHDTSKVWVGGGRWVVLGVFDILSICAVVLRALWFYLCPSPYTSSRGVETCYPTSSYV